MTVPDVADWAGNAAFIDTGRILDQVLNQVTAQYSTPLLDVSRYQSLSILVEWHGAGAANAGAVFVEWYEGGQVIWTDTLTVWNDQALAGASQSCAIELPCLGSQCTVTTNQPSAGDNVTMFTIGSSRPLPRTRALVTGLACRAGCAFGSNNAIAAGVTDTWRIGPMPGDATLFFTTNGVSMTLSILPVTVNSGGGLGNQQLIGLTVSGATNAGVIVLPPLATTITVKNNSGGAGIYTFMLASVP